MEQHTRVRENTHSAATSSALHLKVHKALRLPQNLHFSHRAGLPQHKNSRKMPERSSFHSKTESKATCNARRSQFSAPACAGHEIKANRHIEVGPLRLPATTKSRLETTKQQQVRKCVRRRNGSTVEERALIRRFEMHAEDLKKHELNHCVGRTSNSGKYDTRICFPRAPLKQII